MRKLLQPSHAISGVFVFLLLGIFAVLSTVTVLMGARAYKSTAEQLAAHNAARIAPAYMRSMVRGDDEKGVVSVEEIAGVTAVTLRNEYDGDAYVTRIYCFDGALYEWFTGAENEFFPEDGEKVCPCEKMEASLQEGLLTVRLMEDGRWNTVEIALRAWR